LPPFVVPGKLSVLLIHQFFRLLASRPVVPDVTSAFLFAFDTSLCITLNAAYEISLVALDSSSFDVTAAKFVGTVNGIAGGIFFLDVGITYQDILIEVDKYRFHVDPHSTSTASGRKGRPVCSACSDKTIQTRSTVTVTTIEVERVR
jgi:hypothetical protein